MRRFTYISCFFGTLMLFAACQKGQPAEELNLRSEADIAGLRVGYTSGSIYEMMLSQRSDITCFGFNAPSDDVEALIRGKVDVMVEDDTFMSPEEMARLGVKLAFRGERQFPVAYAFRKNDVATEPVREAFAKRTRARAELAKGGAVK